MGGETSAVRRMRLWWGWEAEGVSDWDRSGVGKRDRHAKWFVG